MLKIKVFIGGKKKISWIEEGVAGLTKRLQGKVDFHFAFAKDTEQLIDWIDKESDPIFLLDENGKKMDSKEFASLIEGRASLVFAIGGAEGFPTLVKQRYSLLSLSPMTFPHQLTRLLLVEQIYRAIQIHANTPYHK